MIYDHKLNNEQTVKKAIKEALHEGMCLVSCKSCGETWFVPGNLKDIMNNYFIRSYKWQGEIEREYANA